MRINGKSAWAAQETGLDQFHFRVNDEEITLTDYRGKATQVRLASSYDVYGMDCHIVSLEGAVFFCDDLTSVILPEGLRHMDSAAFNSTGLKVLYIPSSLTDLDPGFWNYFHDGLRVYYGGSQEQWQALTAGADLSQITVKCGVSASSLR